MLRIFLLIIVLFASPAHGITVTFLQEAEVANRVITLGDIAVIDEDSAFSSALASQPVGQAPSPGQQISLKSQPIVNHLQRAIAANASVRWTGSSQVKITRSSIVISSAEILEIIDTYIQENTRHLVEAKISFHPSAQPLPFNLPNGEMTYQVLPSDPDIIGSSRFSLLFSVNGRVRKNMSVRGQMEVLHPVVTTTTSLRKGSILSPKNTRMTVMDISTLRDPVLDPRKVLGKRLATSLKENSPIAQHQVELVPLVKKGQLVKMIIQSGSLFLTATGIARANGVANEMIKVKNSQTDKIVHCRVAAPGVVEVLL